MSFYNLRRFIYNLQSFNECLFYLLLSYIFTVNAHDNTCTKVTSKMLSSNTKAVGQTCNCIQCAEPRNINLPYWLLM